MKKTDVFVLDTNALISAFLLATTTVSAKAYYKAKETGQIVTSEDGFNEFSDVFVRPKFDKYLPLHKRLTIIEDFRTIVQFISVTRIINVCRDAKDDKYLELAASAKASCIITGDKDLLILNPFENIPIITAADFLKLF